MSITNAARRFEQRFDAKAECFIWHHPLLGFISIFVGMPLLVLACVCISTIVIAFPLKMALVIFCAFKDEIKITTNPKAMP